MRDSYILVKYKYTQWVYVGSRQYLAGFENSFLGVCIRPRATLPDWRMFA